MYRRGGCCRDAVSLWLSFSWKTSRKLLGSDSHLNEKRQKRPSFWLILPYFQLLSHASPQVLHSYVLEPLSAQLSRPISDPSPESPGRTQGSRYSHRGWGRKVTQPSPALRQIAPEWPLAWRETCPFSHPSPCSVWASRIRQVWPRDGSSGKGGEERKTVGIRDTFHKVMSKSHPGACPVPTCCHSCQHFWQGSWYNEENFIWKWHRNHVSSASAILGLNHSYLFFLQFSVTNMGRYCVFDV